MPPRTKHDTAHDVTVDDILDDLRTVVRDAEDLLHATEGQAGEKIAELRARAQETLSGARERLRDAGTGIGAHAKSAARSTDTYVRENPWAAVAIAAGLGYVLGLIGRRR